MSDAEEALRYYGLSEKEIKVYLATLRLGSATVNEISQKADIHRTTTYDILKALVEKGLASYVIKRKTKNFEVADPNKLISILDEKKRKISSIVSELELIKKQVTEKPYIELYEGKEGIKTVMEDILNTKNDILVFSSTEDLFKTLRFYFQNFIKRRKDNQIMARVLTEHTKKTEKLRQKDEKEMRQTKFLPGDIEIPTATYIYGKKTVLISLEGEPIAVLIENESITKTQRITFELLWNIAK